MATQDNNSVKKPGRLEAAEQAEAARRADEAAAQEQLAAQQAELDAQAAAEQETRERQSGQDLASEQRERIKEFARRELRKRQEQIERGQEPRQVSDRAQRGWRGKSGDAGLDVRQKGADLARGIRRAGQSTGEGLRRAGEKTGTKAGQTVGRGAARMAGRIAQAAARAAAQLAARAAAFLASNPIGWTILIIFLILAIVFIAIIMFSAIFRADSGIGGRPQTNPPTFVVDDPTVRRLKALAGDLEARRDSIEHHTAEILAALDAAQKDIEGSVGANQSGILAQIEKTRQAVEKLQAAVEKAGLKPTKEVGKLKLPKYVLAARDAAIREVDALREMIKVLAGSLNERVVAVALAEMAKQPTETDGDNIPVYRAGSEAGQPAPYQVKASSPNLRPWCGIFVQWVMREAGYTNYQGGAGVEYTWIYMKTNHYTFLAGEDTPRPGDLYFRDNLWHIGIVAEVLGDGQNIRVISGNNSHNSVGYATLSTASGRFARMRN